MDDNKKNEEALSESEIQEKKLSAFSERTCV